MLHQLIMEEIFKQIGEFVQARFPDATVADHMKKLQKESREVIKNPSDIFEHVDCLLIVFGNAYNEGFTFEQLTKAASEKIEIVKKRTWERLPDGTFQHVKTENMSKWKSKPPTAKQKEVLDFMIANGIKEIKPQPLAEKTEIHISKIESRLKGLELRGYVERIKGTTIRRLTIKALTNV